MRERLSTGLKSLLAAALYLCVAGVLAAVMLATSASAAGTQYVVSPWAAAEVARAEELGLIADFLGSDYTQPIDRKGFAALAVKYMAEQNNCDGRFFGNLVAAHLAEKNEYGAAKSPFKDIEEVSSNVLDSSLAAYYLGIVNGYSGGTFAPDRGVIRQEAAAMMVRAYKACGGTLPAEAADVTFTDADQIADYAKEDTAALAVWGVMKGNADGSLNPRGSCTIEQAILMFLRLYEEAPVSRAKGNVTPLFTFEQCMEAIDSRNYPSYIGLTYTQVAEGSRGVVVREDMRGNMHPFTQLYFVYRGGGVREIGDAWNSPFTYAEFEKTQFSEDGKILSCTIAVPASYANDGTVLTKVYYQMTVDVDTLKYEVAQIDPEQ